MQQRAGNRPGWRLVFSQITSAHQAMVTRFKLTAKSSNRKTGPIATTMTSADSCPATCPFNNGGGCYAASGPTAIHWGKLSRGETGSDWWGLMWQIKDAKLKPGTLLRHNVAGDLPHTDGRLDLTVVRHLTEIFLGAKLRPFTYTHHRQDNYNLEVIREAITKGFTVNLSCDSEEQASARHRDGFPAVCVVPSTDTRKSWRDESGTRFQTCPAQLKDGITCETCQLCTVADRACVVAFRSHGNSHKRIDKRLAEAIG